MARPLKPETPFAARLVEARLPMERDDFARRLGVPIGTLGNWERGRTFPPPDILTKMAEILDVSLDWLISGRGEKRSGRVQEAAPVAPQLDEELHGRVVEGVMTVYKEEGAGLPPRHLGQLAAQIHGELIAAYTDPAERQIGLKLRLEQLRRELRSTDAGATSSKRLA